VLPSAPLRCGGSCILNRFSCQATIAASLFWFTARSVLLLFRGARNLLPLRPSCQPASSTRFSPPDRFRRLRDLSVQREAASTTAAFRVNSTSSTFYFLMFTASAGGLHRQCGFACPVRGSGLLPPSVQESTPRLPAPQKMGVGLQGTDGQGSKDFRRIPLVLSRAASETSPAYAAVCHSGRCR
jgi:hypothetical protein